jgi:hypothetical protein
MFFFLDAFLSILFQVFFLMLSVKLSSLIALVWSHISLPMLSVLLSLSSLLSHLSSPQDNRTSERYGESYFKTLKFKSHSLTSQEKNLRSRCVVCCCWSW